MKFTCSGVFLRLSAISATTDNFSMGPCTDLDLLNDMRGVPGSSSPPDPLSDGPGLEVAPLKVCEQIHGYLSTGNT